MFNAENYWETRLRNNFSITGVGHCGFSSRYNRLMYRIKLQKLKSALDSCRIQAAGKDVLDVGPGIGVFVKFYLELGAASVTGVDIAETSVNRLRKQYPNQRFIKGDIGDEELELSGAYGIVNAFDVLYHIVEDSRFNTAIARLSAVSKPGAWIFLTDSLVSCHSVEHVRYRSRAEYERVLSINDIEIIRIIGLYHCSDLCLRQPIEVAF